MGEIRTEAEIKQAIKNEFEFACKPHTFNTWEESDIFYKERIKLFNGLLKEWDDFEASQGNKGFLKPSLLALPPMYNIIINK